MKKGYSIITNFGCDVRCSYCIWKYHKLKNIKTVDFQKDIIYDFLKSIPNDIEKFSISGGGDPFFNYKNNKYWWDEIIIASEKYDKVFDIHTSKPEEFFKQNMNKDLLFLNKLNKIVIHTSKERWNPLLYQLFISNGINVRLNFVVNKSLSFDFIKTVENFCLKNGLQLAYRELVKNDNDNPLPIIDNYCKNKNHNLIKYIFQNDYNIYLMPDGKVYDKFQID